MPAAPASVGGALRRPTPRNLVFLARHNRFVEWVVFVIWAIRRSRPLARERSAFVRRELWGERGAVARYELGGSGLAVSLRHRSRDAAVLEEVFVRDWYRPPPTALAAIGDTPRVVGLGGHIGLFGLRVFSIWPDARLTEVEPEPESLAVMRRNIADNGLEDRWEAIEALAAASDGSRSFVSGQSSISRVAGGGTPEGTVDVPAVDVLPLLATADVIKMDIEGGEWELLSDPRFKGLGAKAIVLEHHPQLCPSDSPRGAATELLEDAGYEVVPLWMKENEVGMVWGLKSA